MCRLYRDYMEVVVFARSSKFNAVEGGGAGAGQVRSEGIVQIRRCLCAVVL